LWKGASLSRKDTKVSHTLNLSECLGL
jgi:hypothetical protein